MIVRVYPCTFKLLGHYERVWSVLPALGGPLEPTCVRSFPIINNKISIRKTHELSTDGSHTHRAIL